MAGNLTIGTPVRFNRAFLKTLSDPKDRANTARRRYTVFRIATVQDGTTFVYLLDGRNRESCTTAGWLEVAL